MESTGEGKRERKGTRRLGGVGRRARRLPGHSHPFEVRRKAVQLCLEEGFPVPQVAREMGVGRSTLTKWIKLYRDQGTYPGFGCSYATPGRCRSTFGSGNLVAEERCDYYYSEQKSVTHFSRKNCS